MKREVETNFYEFRQTNSRGHVDISEDLNYLVIVEGVNASDANRRAQEIGIYFDGCDTGRDCSCCGDRWSEAGEIDGKPVPSYYGDPLEEASTLWENERQGKRLGAVVHYFDGTREFYPISSHRFVKEPKL